MDIDINSKKYQKLMKKYVSPAVTPLKGSPVQVSVTDKISAASVYSEFPSFSIDEEEDNRNKKKNKKNKRKRTNTASSDVSVIERYEQSFVLDSAEVSFHHLESSQVSDNTTIYRSFEDSVTYDTSYFEDSVAHLHLDSSTPSKPSNQRPGKGAKQNKSQTTRKASELAKKDPRPFKKPSPVQRATPVTSDRFVSSMSWQMVPVGAVVYLPKYASFGIKGRIRITILQGAVEILGRVLKASPKSYEIYSPKGYSLMVLNCLDTISDFNYSDYLKSRQISVERQPDVNQVCLLMEKIDNRLTKYFEEHVDLNLLRNETVDTTLPTEERHPHRELHQSLCCNVLTKEVFLKSRYYEENPAWRNVAAGLLDALNTGSECRVAVCGGKGVGKSTLLRYLVNTLLNTYPEVLVMDLDPGQGEFTMPTCISVVSVKEALLGPNFSHLQKPEKSLYIGTTDVSSSLSAYLTAISQLTTWFVRQSGFIGKPCIINTMGFSKGLGVDILVDTLRISGVTHVVEIASKSQSRNYPFPLDAYTVSTANRGRITKPSPGDFLLNYSFIRVESFSETAAQPVNEWGHKPASLREYVVLGYLSELCGSGARPSQAVATATPVRIPFSSVAVSCVHEEIKPQFMLSALNGSLVALCTANLKRVRMLRPDDPSLFRIAEKPIPVDCVGFGVITRIDLEARCFYIVTPENIQPSDISLICMGKLFLPDAVYIGGSGQRPFDLTRHPCGSRTSVPYVGESVVAEALSQPFRKYNPFRGTVHIP